jgi:ABC-type phosphate transport system substrate-binding protein
MHKLIWILVLSVVAAPAVLTAEDEDLAVVVNKATSTGNLTKSQIRKLVLGEQGSWPSGEAVTVVLRGPGTAERAAVLRLICRMTEQEYFQHLIHAVQSAEPAQQNKPDKIHVVADSPAAMRQLVSTIPGAIGFLRFKDINESVKVISVDGVAAGEADYKLKTGKP